MSYSGTAFENKYGRKIDVLPVKKWQDGLHPQVTFGKVNIVSGEGKFLPDERSVGGLCKMERKKGKYGGGSVILDSAGFSGDGFVESRPEEGLANPAFRSFGMFDFNPVAFGGYLGQHQRRLG